MSSFEPRNILVIGITAGIKAEHLKWTHEATIAAITKEKERLAKINVTMNVHLLDPSQPVAKHVSDLKALLNSKPYAGVSIGFGVRGSEELTGVFTALVNLIVEEGKDSFGKPPKLLFGLSPEGLFDAVLSVWPEYA